MLRGPWKEHWATNADPLDAYLGTQEVLRIIVHYSAMSDAVTYQALLLQARAIDFGHAATMHDMVCLGARGLQLEAAECNAWPKLPDSATLTVLTRRLGLGHDTKMLDDVVL